MQLLTQPDVFIGQYGTIAAYLFDPYSMAVMKVDRAFESDLEDVRFLVTQGYVDLAQLADCIEDVCQRYDEPRRLRGNFAEFLRGLNG